MIKFNPENKKLLNYGECLKPAMEITDVTEGIEYFNNYVAYLNKFLNDKKAAAKHAKKNLLEFASKYPYDVQSRINLLIKVVK